MLPTTTRRYVVTVTTKRAFTWSAAQLSHEIIHVNRTVGISVFQTIKLDLIESPLRNVENSLQTVKTLTLQL